MNQSLIEKDVKSSAELFYVSKLKKLAFHNMVRFYSYQKRKQYALQFRAIKLYRKTLEAFRLYDEHVRANSHLNIKMMHFLKKQCTVLFKKAFTIWRTKFE